jgi:predicted RecB family nuclease
MTSDTFSATDIANFLACQHLTMLDRLEAMGQQKRPYFPDPSLELLRQLGLEHEQKFLAGLRAGGTPTVVEISPVIAATEAATQTIAALRRGADVIYQPVFLDAQWKGRADFLIRVERPSSFGAWSYEVVEAKLARSTKARALIQLCFYSELLSKIQGIEPQWMYVALGGGRDREKFQVQRYLAYFRKVKREFEEACKASLNTYPEPVEHCDVCDWWQNCDARLRADDHLSLVAGISRNQRKALVDRSVGTVVQLGQLSLPVKPKLERVGDAALQRIREQARLQVAGRDRQQLIHELLEPVELERGLAALPEPSPGDLFFDLESDPYAFDQGIEYLFGIVSVPGEPQTKPSYSSVRCLTPAAEKEAFQGFISTVMERWRQYPGMHIYHYAPYEPTAIKRLAGRHGVCVDEVDQLLTARIFVDLYRVVRQGLRASIESYSIKKIEPLYGFARTVDLRDATKALQAFEAVLSLGDEREDIGQLLATIEGYNRDDCFSTLRLRDWLEERRHDLEKKRGQPLPRPATKSGARSENLEAELGEIRTVMRRLLDGLPVNEAEWTEEQRARWLSAQMLEWHRREEKSAWWEYFRLLDLTDEELQEDKSALGGLRYLGEVDRIDRSIIYRYRFPPQDHAIDPGTSTRDPKTEKSAGKVVAVDDRNWTIDLKRGAASQVPHPEALIPFESFGTKEQRASLLRLGSWVAKNGLDGSGPFRAARDLLLRLPPRLVDNSRPLVKPGELLSEAANRLSLRLEASVLPMQGPPGSGKTYTGARVIVELVKRGKRVGITAVSHKVISNLLKEVCEAAQEARISVRTVQKPNEDGDGYEHALVEWTTKNERVLEALTSGEAQVAAGTAWLWSREDMADTVDVLFVDEAGQMSLANVLAVSQAAGSLILLGDPQQLDQPQKGVHPPGADVSALAHLLNGRPTISDECGLFLLETWRLHPDVCAFTSELFYEGRLKSRPENLNQRLNADDPLGGTGLRYIPVEHTGNQSESAEEAEVVKRLVGKLLSPGTTWINKKGEAAPLTLKDILVVAPYNAHVSLLTDQFPQRARVGTVDKFQGQEAPVVIYSMATSTPEDAPRGMEFLYSLNRLNVATSRAQCVTVLVASPALFNVQCKTPRQMELANAFCRYLEMALVT